MNPKQRTEKKALQDKKDAQAAEQKKQAQPNKVVTVVPMTVPSLAPSSSKPATGTGQPVIEVKTASSSGVSQPVGTVTPEQKGVAEPGKPLAKEPLAEMKGLAEFKPRPNPHQLFADERFSYQILTEDKEDKTARDFEAGLADLLEEAKRAKNESIEELFARRLFSTPKAAGPEQQAPRSAMVMTEYHPLLKHGAIPERLLKSERFRGRYELRADPSDKQRVKVFDRKAGLVAVLLLGNAEAYKTITEATDTKRKTLKKRHIQVDGPTHVADDAGVPTRRFAYFETSRQQLMAALGDGAEGKLVPALRGRYVRHRLAMGLAADITMIEPDVAKIFGIDSSRPARPDQVAAVHQYLGSGMQQRGVSLTSTPKPQVYSNDGDLFASPDGVRIKVDLTLVPKDVMLLNHYAEGGVGSRLAADSNFPPQMLKKPDTEVKGRSYNYAASVVKNRELLLQELRPEWIFEIIDHLKDGPAGSGQAIRGPAAVDAKTTTRVEPRTAQSGADLKGKNPMSGRQSVATGGSTAEPLTTTAATTESKIKSMRGELGYDHYEAGRRDALADKPNDPSSHVGAVAAGSYKAGYGAGYEERLGGLAAKLDITEFWIGYETVVEAVAKAFATRANIDATIAAAIPPFKAGQPGVRHMGASAAKFLTHEERKQAFAEKSDWFVLCGLRREINAAFPVEGTKTMIKFRPDMHDTYWLGWATAVRISKEEAEKAAMQARTKSFATGAWGTGPKQPSGSGNVQQAKTGVAVVTNNKVGGATKYT